MKTKAVIFDIDNTLLSQARRLTKAYNTMMGTSHTIEELQQEGASKYELPVHMLKVLTPDQSKAYYQDFLTTKYYDKAEGYNLDEVVGAKKFLHFLHSKGIKILYMSARINCPGLDHTDITNEMLEYYDFPRDAQSEVHLLESDHIPNNSQDFHILADSFKSQRSKDLLGTYDIIAGVGDAKSDISAFNSAGITSIQARTVIPASMYDDNADSNFKDWEELYKFDIFSEL